MHSFRYHKQFFHGISSVSGQEFMQPLETRWVDQDLVEGLCHQCYQWVSVSNVKRKNSVLWYRHAHKVDHDSNFFMDCLANMNFITSVMFITSPKLQPPNDVNQQPKQQKKYFAMLPFSPFPPFSYYFSGRSVYINVSCVNSKTQQKNTTIRLS